MKGIVARSTSRRYWPRLALAGTLLASSAFARPGDSAADADLSAPAGEGLVGFGSPWNLGFADFLPQSPGSADCYYSMPPDDNFSYVSSDAPGGTCCVVAPVHVPTGATVTAIVFYLRDESSDDVTMSLRRKRLVDLGNSQVLGSITTSSSGSGVRVFSDATITNGVIDNDQYLYFVSSDTCLDQGLSMRLYHGRIFYSE